MNAAAAELSESLYLTMCSYDVDSGVEERQSVYLFIVVVASRRLDSSYVSSTGQLYNQSRYKSNSHLLSNSSYRTYFTMSGNSQVGTRALYEADDQRNYRNSEIQERARYQEGNPNAHLAHDSSTISMVFASVSASHELTRVAEDQRSIANRLAAEEVWPNCHPPARLDAHVSG